LRIPRGCVLIDKFMSSYNVVSARVPEIARKCRVLILEEPVIVLSTFYREGEAIIRNKYFAVGVDSIIICGCDYSWIKEYLLIEKDSWGKARIVNEVETFKD